MAALPVSVRGLAPVTQLWPGVSTWLLVLLMPLPLGSRMLLAAGEKSPWSVARNVLNGYPIWVHSLTPSAPGVVATATPSASKSPRQPRALVCPETPVSWQPKYPMALAEGSAW